MGSKRNVWDLIAWVLMAFIVIALGVSLVKAVGDIHTVTEVKPYGITKTVIEPQVKIVEVEKIVTKVETKTVTEYVEVPVEVETIKYVTDEVAMNDTYISGYEDGRIEGEDWQHSLFNRALTTPCEQEDSDNCYWDASTRGNGEGTSFVVVDGTVYSLGD